MLIGFYFLLQVLAQTATPISVAPSWVTSPYVQANTRHVINGNISGAATGNSSTPTATIPFATAFPSSAPNLAYAILYYEGTDAMSSQMFEVNRTGLTTTSFSVLIQISGITNIWILSVRYFAISKLFPHHLNSFDNVPINYNAGPLVNVTTPSLTVYNSYYNVINYTAQALASGYNYTTFSLPLSNCKILLFTTTLFVQGSASFTAIIPLDLRITATILTTQTYKLTVSFGLDSIITKLRFSMIVFDEKDVESSYAYQLVYTRLDFPTTGGFYPLPAQFATNSIAGFVEFSAPKIRNCTMHFNLVYQASPSEGINMPVSIPRNVTKQPFSRFGYSFFYLKTWLCPNNTFYNISSGMCVSCPIPNCVTCLNIDKCQICDTANGYGLNPNASINLQCSLCNDPNCLACPNRTTCITCDASANYFAVSGACVLCTIPNCQHCLNLTVCQICDQANNYVLNSTVGATVQCIPCPLSNCLQCLNQTNCQICDQANGFFFNSTTQQCQACTIPNCVTCSSLTQCLQCDQPNSYFLVNTTNISDQCQLCSIANCIVCLNLTTCTVCNESNNFFYSPTPTNISDQCIQCPLSNCLWCDNITSCQICNETNNFFLNQTTLLCEECSLTGCVFCNDSATCAVCNNSANYFLNASDSQCVTCSIPYCLQCSSLTTCQICNIAANYFANPVNQIGNQCIPCTLSGCARCYSLSSCAICDTFSGYFFNASALRCQLCAIPNCLQCNSLITCRTSDQVNNFYLNMTDSRCYSCNIPNCLQCSNLTTCLVCDVGSNYFLDSASGQCQLGVSICGDNIFLLPEQCDDGNLEDGDGCSGLCNIEIDWVCQPNNATGMLNSVCFYIGLISLRVVYIEKVDNANQIEILLEVTPSSAKFWDNVDFASMVSLSNMTSFDSFSVRKNTDGTVSVLVNYSADIQDMEITVQLDPKKSGKLALSRLSSSSRNFQVVPSDNQAALLYDDNYYGMSGIVSILAYVIAGLSLLFFLLGIFARKIIGIQMVAVVQISYLSLLTLTSLNPSFKALTNIWFVNGFSYFSLSKGHLQDQFSPLQAKGLFLYSRFAQNYNFTLLLIILPYIASLICFILSRTKDKHDLKQRTRKLRLARRLACESAFNGVMFSGYIVAVSFGLEALYGSKNMAGFIGLLSIFECCVLLILYATYFVLIIKFDSYFGEFVYYFKKKQIIEQSQQEKVQEKDQDQEKEQEQKKDRKSYSTLSQKWYNLLMIQRIIVGSCLVFLLQVELSPLATIAVFLLLGAYAILRQPYLKRMHNIRFACNMLICIFIQVIYLCYKKATFHDQNKQPIWLTMPIIVCILLLVCIIYNLIAFIIELRKGPQYKSDSESIKEEEEIVKEMINMSMGTNPLIEPHGIPFSPTRLLHTDEKTNRDELNKIRERIKGDFMINRKEISSKNILKFEEEQTDYMNELNQI